MLVVGGVFAALVAMLLNALGQADLTTLIFLLLWVAGAGLGFAWTLRSYLSQVYSLTSKRVLVRSRFLPFRAAIPGSQIIQIAADNAAATWSSTVADCARTVTAATIASARKGTTPLITGPCC